MRVRQTDVVWNGSTPQCWPGKDGQDGLQVDIIFDDKLYFSSPTGAAVDSLNTDGDCSCTHCNSDVCS